MIGNRHTKVAKQPNGIKKKLLVQKNVCRKKNWEVKGIAA
jgi:hypothetical protein